MKNIVNRAWFQYGVPTEALRGIKGICQGTDTDCSVLRVEKDGTLTLHFIQYTQTYA